MSAKTRATLVEIISILFIILFVYAAVSKWIDFPRFKVQVGQSPILTDFSAWIPWLVPALEIVISLLIILPFFRLRGLYVAFSLMIIFTGYIILIEWFSPFTPCSCGGILQSMSWNQHLVFNILFVGLAAGGILLDSTIPPDTKHLLQ